jgi:hypothetical protein
MKLAFCETVALALDCELAAAPAARNAHRDGGGEHRHRGRACGDSPAAVTVFADDSESP